MKTNELPLQQLFTKLREAGLPLGIDEYQLVLRSLQAGFGIADKAALKRLCQTLWVKSVEEKSILEYHFEQVIPSDLVAPVSEKDGEINKSRLHQVYQIATYVILGMLEVGIIFGVRESQKNPITPQTTTPNTRQTQPENPNTQQTQPENPTPNTQQTQPETITSTTKQTNFLVWILLFISATTCEYLLFRWLSHWLSQQQAKPNSSPPSSTPVSKVRQEAEDKIQVVTSVLQATGKYLHANSVFFPVTQRQMKQVWRYLRRPVREGKPTELDVEATVNQIGQQGLSLEIVLVPPRVNRAELLIIIDQDGSMVTFHALSHCLAKTALGGGRLGRTGIYYFHNCPIEYLYRDRYHQEAELISNVLTHSCSERTAVLIFSDAGAARGGYSEERYELTQEFLTQLQKRVRHIVWLNPIPRKRWLGTTAGEIARLIPMFELNRPGLQDAISVLRGRPTNFEGWRK